MRPLLRRAFQDFRPSFLFTTINKHFRHHFVRTCPSDEVPAAQEGLGRAGKHGVGKLELPSLTGSGNEIELKIPLEAYMYAPTHTKREDYYASE